MTDLQKIFLALVGFTVALIVVAVLALQSSNLNFWGEVGKALLASTGTLLTALLITGALTLIINRGQENRAIRTTKRECWRDILRDLLAVNDTVQTARLLIDAHRTAKTYGEQMRQVTASRSPLLKLQFDPDVIQTQDGLAGSFESMHRYLEALGKEYKEVYLEASLRQRLDEAILKKSIDEQAKSPDGVLPPSPSQAWQFLEEQCSRLMEFLDPEAFAQSEYRVGYASARQRVQEQLEHFS